MTKDQISQIDIGLSTQEDVQKLLGSPQRIKSSTTHSQASETWTYCSADYSSNPYVGVPPIGMTSVPISRNSRRVNEIEITFDHTDVITAIEDKSKP